VLKTRGAGHDVHTGRFDEGSKRRTFVGFLRLAFLNMVCHFVNMTTMQGGKAQHSQVWAVGGF
jgi:hypothetical protein